MYERDYGYKYNDPAATSSTAIAKLIRADIKQATQEGLLPKHWKYSVRTAYFSGGSSIEVMVRNCADAWQDCDGGSKHAYPGGGWSATGCPNAWCKAGGIHKDHPSASVHQVLTEDAAAAKMTLERIHGAYNHDGSEIQTDYFDVRYYGSVSFDR